MEFIPQNVRFASAKLSGYSRNRFKIMPTGSQDASAGRQTVFNLPENALIDTASLRLHCTVKTTGATVNSTSVYALLPADGASLIQRLNVSINGVSVQNQSSEYNSVCRILKLAGGSDRNRDGTVDRAVSHGAIVSDDSNEHVSLIISEWHGILNESSTRFWPTNAIGAVQLELTWADNSVLVPKQDSKDFEAGAGGNLSADAKTAAAQISYSVEGLYMTVDTIQFGDGMYDQLLRKRLADEPYIPIAFRDYYTFSHDGIDSDAKSIRFAVSASSIDKIYTSFRNGSYRSVGIRGHKFVNQSFSDALCANYFRFRSYDSQSTRAGDLKMQYQINNTPHPTYQMNVPEALCDIAYVNDKIGPSAPGIIQTSLQSFNDGMFVCPLTLCHPSGNMIGQMGYDSRGVTSQMEFTFTGMSVPTADSGTQQTGSVSAFTVVQVTSELRLSLGREVVVAH